MKKILILLTAITMAMITAQAEMIQIEDSEPVAAVAAAEVAPEADTNATVPEEK